MFPFKQPPSKFEVAKQSVSDAAHHLIDAVPTEKIEEKFDDLKKSAVIAALGAAQAAHHAGELAAHKLEELQSAAAHLGGGASKTAQTAAHNAEQTAAAIASRASAATQAAREGAQTARENLSEKAATLRDSAAESVGTLKNLKERAAHDFKVGSQEAQNVKDAAQKAAQRETQAVAARAEAVKAKAQVKAAEIARKTAEAEAHRADDEAEAAKNQAIDAKNAAKEETKAVLEQTKQKAKERAAQTFERLPQSVEVDSTEIKIAESGSKWGWILVGLAVGAALVFLLAPTSGRRSRAAIKDRLDKVGDGVVDAATATSDKVVDIAQRVEGLTHKAESKLAADGESDDDATVTDRVRSVLGHHEIAKNLERLNIDCVDGVVTLRGPMIDENTQQVLIAAVSAVPGVKEVVADFLTDEEPMDPAKSIA